MTPHSSSSPTPASLAHSPFGIHIAMECSGCRDDLIRDAAALKASLISAATDSGATVVDSLIHHYNPAGLSGVVVIQESHLAIHTWPEIGYASFDIYTCGELTIAEAIADHLLATFSPSKVTRNLYRREPPEQLR